MRFSLNEAADALDFSRHRKRLAPDYLQQAVALVTGFSHIGVFGGRITAEFDAEHPAWLRPFYAHLAVTTFALDEWAYVGDDRAVIPCGSGFASAESRARIRSVSYG
jgi:hypothetical protein